MDLCMMAVAFVMISAKFNDYRIYSIKGRPRINAVPEWITCRILEQKYQ